MKQYYFTGGPKPGCAQEFFRRLQAVGGVPAGWRVYPHASDDGKALHIAEVDSVDEILAHLGNFDGIYEWGTIVEIMPPRE